VTARAGSPAQSITLLHDSTANDIVRDRFSELQRR
jgi:hypothetical protein